MRKNNPMDCLGEVSHERVHFSGRVQGVGFRYTALRVAQEFEVTGYAQNLPDGRVLLEVEGTAPTVEAFIGAIQERMQGYIRKIERQTTKRRPEFRDFTIR
ncbi:MAG: acylphosphatase [Opitutaceae bacterium]|nr:acylphosphatase [Opitutaceae bacterium]